MSKNKNKKDKTFKTHSDFVEAQHRIEQRLPLPPYFRHFYTSPIDGGFGVKDAIELAPEEALKLGKWLVEYYGVLEKEPF